MHKRAFQGLKLTFRQVSGLTSPYFDNKNKLIGNLFFLNQNLVGEDLRHS